ncbi:hypothetical protein F5144DRAFT_575392 [Chaetomium tenue]|uniref:Uncharacterized protein n=1 Tax=Chaetomium tenue TaxID=1854479 RepID=A0ACB7PEB4_9PEZI|nr:hypothetical protein F5144DRAFT_575392 [Chaetomium globosum]
MTLSPRSSNGGRRLAAGNPYYDLGRHTRRVSTRSPDAQTWFDRGLNWVYAFNHAEAAACFGQVVLHDPDCAMGYWGVAFATGPNYNKGWSAFDKEDLSQSLATCYNFSRKAQAMSGSATPVERALIDALTYRFPSATTLVALGSRSVLAYADAMRQVGKDFGEQDLDVTTLVADALMNTAPWRLYRAKTGEPNPNTPVLEIREMLERGMALPDAKYHPGILHMYIHLVEMSKMPEDAVNAADYLRGLVPDAGHLHHMPSHIDVLVGDYRRALHANLEATIADDKYYAREGGRNFYSFYRMHNYHSLIYNAMMAGQSQAALDATTRMEDTITETMLLMTSPPMASWLEFFKSVRVHVLIRFGMWEELKQLPVPEDKELYCVTVAMTYYGKGIAYAATNDVKTAVGYQDIFRDAARRVPPSRLDFPNRVVDELAVAAAMLEGEIEYRRGNYEVAFKSLRLAIARDDSLLYSEPWGWMIPSRHPYAALLLEQGHVDEAARIYADDLGLGAGLVRAHQHPNNIWALHGYHECLQRLGRTAEASIIRKQLSLAMAGADTKIESSCFCRLKPADDGVTKGCRL